jgi:hypothetical protein
VGGSKTKQTTNQQQSSTVQLPAWMTEAGQGLYQDAKRTADANPIQGYNGELAPGMSGNQMMASQAARSSYGSGQRDLNAARMLTMQGATGGAQTVDAPQQEAATAGDAPLMRAAQQGAAATMRPAFQTLAPSVAADQVGSANFTPDAAAQYMSPYQKQVQDATLGEMRRQGDIDRSTLQDSIQGAGAWGGTRQALAESELGRNQQQLRDNYVASSNEAAFNDAANRFQSDRASRMQADLANQGSNLQADTTTASFLDQLLGRNQAAANDAGQFNATATNAQRAADATLRQQAGQSNQDVRSRFQLSDQAAENQARGANADRQFDANKTNASLYQSMLDRLLQGGSQMAGYGGQANDMAGADIGRLALTGQTEQDTSGKQDAAKYNEFLRMQDAPMDRYRDLMAILSGTPRNVSTNGTSSGTSVTQQSGGLLNQLLAAGQIAASAFSDRRLKRDVTRLATSTSGLGLYAYRYLWDDEPRIGVMADEVERIAPEALGPVVAGFKTVNYSALEGAL